MKLISDIDVRGKRVFVRADLDVPLREQVISEAFLRISDQGKVISQEATRLVNLKPTVEYLLEHGAKQIVIAGHIDRPQGLDPKLSTAQLQGPLESLLSRSVTFRPELEDGSGSLASMAQLILLENLRFWPGETANDVEFAKQMALTADVYVNEAFGNSHREHASMVALPSLLPHAAGLHLEREIEVLSKLLTDPERPFVAIVGGAKVETKVPVIDHLAKIADSVLVGGEVALEIQNSKQTVFLRKSKTQKYSSKVKIAELTPDTKDIDQKSVEEFKSIICQAKTIVWNGPMGLFEEGFDKGTIAVAQAITDSNSFSVVGGGDTTQFLESKNLLGGFSFVSSGGGAMLEFLAGKDLPGLSALL